MGSQALALAKFSGRGSQLKTTKKDRRAVSSVTRVCREACPLAAVQVGSPGSGVCGQVAPLPCKALPAPVTPRPKLGVLVG